MPSAQHQVGDTTPVPQCPSCRRPLPTWGGEGPPPWHYAHMPGIGVPCDGKAGPPVCYMCAHGQHSICQGGTIACPTGCQCPTVLCTRIRDARLPMHQRTLGTADA